MKDYARYGKVVKAVVAMRFYFRGDRGPGCNSEIAGQQFY